MKKMYTLALACIFHVALVAQIPVLYDLEDRLSNPESFNNGSAGSTDFDLGVIRLTNEYNSDWGSWNGFSFSNITDNTTAGWGNQYASYAGGGRNSATYAVFYPQGAIEMNGPGKIDSFFVTNTAYAAISMRDGDLYSKQFGSIYNANGEVDGTNGEDFLRLWIIVEGMSTLDKDSIEFYLADYRFADDQEDYIVNDWRKIDVSTFGYEVYKVSFRFESSDMGEWGINTPTYFAIDDISTQYYGSLAEHELIVEVYPNPVSDRVYIKGEKGSIELSDVNGNVLVRGSHHEFSVLDMSNYAPGVYFLKIENEKGQKETRKLIR